jgi:hypothetical protein
MEFYPSKTNDKLNRQPFAPEQIAGRAMVNPLYPVALAPGTQAACDSMAFQTCLSRMQPWTALDRQLRFEQQIAWGMHTPDWYFEAVMTYDMLVGVDETIVNGKRVKQRGDEKSAAYAVAETIRSARHYHAQRERIRGAIAYAAQGATPAQYLACTEALLPLLRPERDWYAFGGFCIIGRMPKRMMSVFEQTLDLVMPRLKEGGIARAHILGVCYPPAIALATQYECAYGVALSTDSSGLEQAAVFGRTYEDGDGVQRQRYTKAQKYIDYHPAQLAIQNIRDYSAWLETLKEAP